MRFIPVSIILVSAACVFFSCKKNKAEPRITPASKNVTLWAGKDTAITISGVTGRFTATSGDETIASAVVQNDKVLISTDMPGSTTIKITDEAERTAEIKVMARSLDGPWRRVEGSSQLVTQVLVEANNADFANDLESQLLAEAEKPVNARYGLLFITPAQTFQEFHGNTLIREGTFSFRKLTLTLTQDAQVEVYQLNPIGAGLIGLERDLTEEQKALHPDKGITKVVVIRYLLSPITPG